MAQVRPPRWGLVITVMPLPVIAAMPKHWCCFHWLIKLACQILIALFAIFVLGSLPLFVFVDVLVVLALEFSPLRESIVIQWIPT